MPIEFFFNRPAAEINGVDENPSVLLFNILVACSLATFLVSFVIRFFFNEQSETNVNIHKTCGLYEKEVVTFPWSLKG